MIVKGRRCRRCAGQLYVEWDQLQGCFVIQCLHCSHEAGTIHRDQVPPPVQRRLSPG